MDAAVGISTKITEHFATMESLRRVPRLCLLHGVGVPPAVMPRGRTGEPLRILYLGRIMDPQKRVYLFPQILKALQDASLPFQWTIAGEGDRRAELEQAMQPAAANQKINFPGPVPNAQVPALLEQHDIFLLASDAEGLPISLLEAMAHGVVPVITDLESGIRDVVDATNGMLVPVDDVAGYARAILHLHAHREELAAKSAAAHERVQTAFSVEAMTDRWLAAFPPVPAVPPIWPRRWRILAPLTAPRKIYFSPPVRFFRRLARKFAHGS
jgi:glycosyltransferase involved in cell wall biosynthesis